LVCSGEAADYSHPLNGPANAREPIIRVIHITDPHLTSLEGLPLWSLRGKRWSGYLSWRRRRRFFHRREVLERLTAAVQSEDPGQILVTGDLVHVGLPEEIDAAARWLEALGTPDRVMLVPGNHDVYARDSWPAMARAWQPYLTFPQDFPQDAAGSHALFPLCRRIGNGDGALCLIGLSSALTSPLFMAYGRLGDDQRARLETALAQADGFRCVLVHHPPLPNMTRWRKGLLDAVELERVLARRGVELVLHGHVHHNVARLGPGDAHIYGTASASSSHGHALASYRSFDVTASEGRWRVDMRLVTLETDGCCRVAGRETWEVPFRPSASAASAGR
jgi:3',5'-cyclic AMP phosphodiesterase CpdA